jgi:peptide-methionine (S)-S-oxide reductase
MKDIHKAIFAGGCFWCTEAVFQQIKGVEEVIPGYTGGKIKNPAYREVCTGRTGHAEAIQIKYNREVVSFESLLELFFATHDPTTLNRQGNDIGSHYRSAVFYTSEEQKKKASAFIKVLEDNKVFSKPIVTQLEPFEAFYKAEEVHHNYYNENKEQPYCQFLISPKLEKVQKYYSEKIKTN